MPILNNNRNYHNVHLAVLRCSFYFSIPFSLLGPSSLIPLVCTDWPKLVILFCTAGCLRKMLNTSWKQGIRLF